MFSRSVKEVLSGNHEQTEEHIEKQDKVRDFYCKVKKVTVKIGLHTINFR